MIVEKYFGMDKKTAQQLITATAAMIHDKSGNNDFQQTKVFLFDEYAVLKMKNINVRNVVTQDPELKYLERLAVTLLDLYADGVNVVPILAFQSDEGDGYIIQSRAKGSELYDRDKLNNKHYITERVELLSNAPQKHFDKFVADAIKIMNTGVLVDFVGKDNFFYHESLGFQFIDLYAHFDSEYGLTDNKPPIELIAALNCFLPCYYDTMPQYCETVSIVWNELTNGEKTLLREHNRIIFEKCKKAIIKNGITNDMMDEVVINERFIPQMKQYELI